MMNTKTFHKRSNVGVKPNQVFTPASSDTACEVKSTHRVSAPHQGNANLPGVTGKIHAEFLQIVSQSDDESQLVETLLDRLLRVPGIVGSLLCRPNDDGEQIVVDRLGSDLFRQADVRKWLVELAETAVLQQGPMRGTSDRVRNLQAVAIPIPREGRPAESLVVLSNGETAALEQAESVGCLTVDCLLMWHMRHGNRKTADWLRTTSAVLELVGHIESGQTLEQACTILADEVREHLNCRAVAIGIRPEGKPCRLTQISGLAEFDRRTPLAGRFEAALNEAVLRNDLSSWPPVDETGSHQNVGHRQLAEAAAVEAVVSTPLVGADGESHGALLSIGRRSLALDPIPRGFVRAIAEPAGRAVEVVRRAQGSRWQRALRAIGSKKWAMRRRLTLVALAAVIGLMFFPVPQKIRCDCTLEPVQHRFSVAPLDGLLEQTFVEPGEIVAKDQLLARMDGREIRWKQAGTAADYHGAVKKRDYQRARHEVPEAIMAELEMKSLKTESDLLAFREAHLEVRSPIDGVVLSGSLDRRENYPVSMGQMLYEIGPLDPLRVEVAVPAEEITYVQEGMSVTIRLEGQLTEPVTGTIDRIRPRSDVLEDANVFIAEVEISNIDNRLRPGMEGTAMVVGRRRSLGWNLFHRPWEHLVVLWKQYSP